MDVRTRLLRSMFQMKNLYFDYVKGMMGDMGNLHPRQAPLLVMLLHQEGVSQADLVRQMNVTAATVAVSISRLEKLGYVTRERNEQNHRANVLRLSEKGSTEAKKLESAMEKVRGYVLNGFSDEELEQVASYFDRMHQNLSVLNQDGEGNENKCTKCSNT